MPLYEFHCDSCGTSFDELVRAGAIPRCQNCGSQRVQRRWSSVSTGPRLGTTGRAAKESNSRRAEREAKRKESFVAERKRKKAAE